jgi:hypothetical protein
VKKLFLLLLVAALGVVAVRRVLGSGRAAVRQHGTPDRWPPVVRKPGTEAAPAA